jgi:hypothetical protein
MILHLVFTFALRAVVMFLVFFVSTIIAEIVIRVNITPEHRRDKYGERYTYCALISLLWLSFHFAHGFPLAVDVIGFIAFLIVGVLGYLGAMGLLISPLDSYPFRSYHN